MRGLVAAPRIDEELLKLGFELVRSTVARYMIKPREAPSQGWRTFLWNRAPEIAATVFLWSQPSGSRCFMLLSQSGWTSRALVWINVTQNPTAGWVTHLLADVLP